MLTDAPLVIARLDPPIKSEDSIQGWGGRAKALDHPVKPGDDREAHHSSYAHKEPLYLLCA
ncbi:MAG: hypothetical protein ACE5OR_00260 [bacterium]